MKTEKELKKFVKPIWDKKDPMHNFKHLLRIKKEVKKLKKQYKKLDEDFLNFLIYFHGSWAKKNKKKVLRLGYPASWISKIDKPTTPEGKIVWDANMLENTGKFGIKKSLVLEKHYNQSRAETLKIVENFIKKYKFYTPLGKKIGDKRIEIKKKWFEKEKEKLKK
ncbi:hypothetical protein ACFL0X_00330 [Nanoarchaeota archaeon]